jgi:hypothetical protein
MVWVRTLNVSDRSRVLTRRVDVQMHLKKSIARAQGPTAVYFPGCLYLEAIGRTVHFVAEHQGNHQVRDRVGLEKWGGGFHSSQILVAVKEHRKVDGGPPAHLCPSSGLCGDQVFGVLMGVAEDGQFGGRPARTWENRDIEIPIYVGPWWCPGGARNRCPQCPTIARSPRNTYTRLKLEASEIVVFNLGSRPSGTSDMVSA